MGDLPVIVQLSVVECMVWVELTLRPPSTKTEAARLRAKNLANALRNYDIREAAQQTARSMIDAIEKGDSIEPESLVKTVAKLSMGLSSSDVST